VTEAAILPRDGLDALFADDVVASPGSLGGIPLLRDVTTEIERARAQERIEGLALLAAHGSRLASSSSVR
jgi:hypothetical protein